jgi:cell division protein FtsQ
VSSVEDEATPLPGDLDAEDESPYLRRQKAMAVRRRRFSVRARWVVVNFAALLAAGAVSYALVSFALHSPRFLLTSADDILVDGNRYVSRQEIVRALGFPATGPVRAPVNLFRLSLAEKRKQVEAIPWVRSASLARAYPHRLAVHVVERVPVAFANVAGRLKVVDGDGLFLEKPERAEFDFPVVSGLEIAPALTERKQRLALYQDFVGGVAEEAQKSGWMISEVNLGDADDLRALMIQGPDTIEFHFGDRGFAERFGNFLAMLPEVRKTNARLDSVDLRYQNQIVVNQKGRGK